MTGHQSNSLMNIDELVNLELQGVDLSDPSYDIDMIDYDYRDEDINIFEDEKVNDGSSLVSDYNKSTHTSSHKTPGRKKLGFTLILIVCFLIFFP